MGRLAALLIGLLLVLVALAGHAHALMKAGAGVVGGGLNVRMGPAGGTPPLDGLTTPAAAYSLRKLRTAYAGSAVRIRRASDNAEINVGFLGFVPGLGAPLDVAAANAHCAATTCFVVTWYDQSGNARDGTRAAAQQPSFIFNCNGTLPCLRSSSSGQLLGAPNSAVALPVTLNGVAIRNSGAGTCVFPQHYEANNSLGSGPANQWVTYSSGGVPAAAADAAWHSAVGILNNGANATSLRVDGGSDVTGTVTVSTTAEPLAVLRGRRDGVQRG